MNKSISNSLILREHTSIVNKHCPRCSGKLFIDAYPGDISVYCVNCGWRLTQEKQWYWNPCAGHELERVEKI